MRTVYTGIVRPTLRQRIRVLNEIRKLLKECSLVEAYPQQGAFEIRIHPVRGGEDIDPQQPQSPGSLP